MHLIQQAKVKTRMLRESSVVSDGPFHIVVYTNLLCFFPATLVGCFTIVPIGIVRSYISKTVDPDEVGKRLQSVDADIVDGEVTKDRS